VEPLPTQQAAAAASVATTTGGPAALRGKGLGGPTTSAPLTYSGPRDDGGTETRRAGGAAGATSGQGAATATGAKEPARNAPCPCGSGKKYKLCHGRPGAN
jgi:preprotein translocase subunit SecA